MLRADLKKNILPFTFLLPVAAALLNTGYFGAQTLTAYFLYTIFASFCVIIIAGRLMRFPALAIHSLPGHIYIFIVLVIFVFAHGMVTRTLNLTHYYWVASAAWLTGMSMLIVAGDAQQPLQKNNRNHNAVQTLRPTQRFIFNGITFLASIESIIVLLQWLKVVPSQNPLFACTGTWVNPNVTAMFLSLSLYSALESIKDATKTKAALFALVLILLAIFALQCRSAYLVSALFLIASIWQPLAAFLKKRPSIIKKVLVSVSVAGLAFLLFILAFSFKKASSDSRMHIWENCAKLIATAPFTGQGFGLFEKQYNLYAATNKLPGNDHVFMPYNDFLELGVEGGVIASVLWLTFIIELIRYNFKHHYAITPAIAFLIIQITNFGFQAIPAFALFLLYTGISNCGQETGLAPNREAAPSGKVIFIRPVAIVVFIASVILLVHQSVLAKAFYTRNDISSHYPPADAIEAYQELCTLLTGFQSYHESYGDAYFALKQYRPALQQYLQAAQYSSLPGIFSKCAYCYRQQHDYDSSKYYYTIVQDMQPYKFAPRIALLTIYEQTKDSANMYNKATEILNMPVKVESPQVEQMKAYAHKILNSKLK